jgi:hypothetical protein
MVELGSPDFISTCSYVQAEWTLETMPAELKIRIMLFLPDVASLRSLILASPSHHATYLAGARQEVLKHLVIKQLDDRLLVDALAAVRSSDFYIHGKRDTEDVGVFIDDYSLARENPPSSSVLANGLFENGKVSSLEEAILLCLLNIKVSRLIDDYLRSTPRLQCVSVPLSEWERIRLYRAICRYQIYCNLFGSHQKMASDTLRRPRAGRPWNWDPSSYFVSHFLPWELQEVGCICEYLATRWAFILRECSVTSPEDPKKADYPLADYGWRNKFAKIRSLPSSPEGIVFFIRNIYPLSV